MQQRSQKERQKYFLHFVQCPPFCAGAGQHPIYVCVELLHSDWTLRCIDFQLETRFGKVADGGGGKVDSAAWLPPLTVTVARHETRKDKKNHA